MKEINNNIYLKKFIAPIRVSAGYRPKFGLGKREEGIGLDRFLDIYGRDPFYAWCGLDSKLMYAAHKAAGGMTSIYRQIGKGCENLFKEILIKSLQYGDRKSADWSYVTKTQAGKEKRLSLDGRIEFRDIKNKIVAGKIKEWTKRYCDGIGATMPQNGIVFEVRQGYKSKDSKRQNADIDNISVAWSQGYLPIFAIFSAQIDDDIILRYRNNRGGILTGSLEQDDCISLFAFCEAVLDFNLVDFFEKNSKTIQAELDAVLQALLGH